MRLHARVLGLGAAALAAAVVFLTAAGDSAADEKDAKAIREHLMKMADAVEKNDAAEVKAQAEALKKFELLPIMQQLKLRANGGIGIGQPGTVTPDGIEAKLIGMARKPMTKGELDKQGADLAKAAYVMAAIAEVGKDRSPVKKKMGDKDPKDWAKWMDDMAKFSREVAAAAREKDPNKVKAASANLNSSCNSCHSVFRD